MKPLSASDIQEAFDDLAERLFRRGVQARIYIAGGAAMALLHDKQRYTRDVDASIIDGYDEVIAETRAIARERGWPTTWLNKQATIYMPQEQDRRGVVVYEHSALSVVGASAEHLLAMKARSARRSDEADVRLLASHLDISSVDDITEIVSKVFPDEPMERRQTDWLRRVVEEPKNQTSDPPSDSDTYAVDVERLKSRTAKQASPKKCGVVVRSTGLKCFLLSGHGGNHRSRRSSG